MMFLAMTQNGWTASEVSVAQEWKEKIQHAAVQCQGELPVMLRRRESNKGGAVPRWAELGKEALSMLISHPLGVGEEIATQLSQVLAAHQGEADCVLQVQRARELQKALLSGGPDALQKSGVSNATLWCPTEPEAVGRLMAAYSRHAVSAESPCRLRLVIALDAPGGCSDAQALTDLWSHPVLLPKWAHLVEVARFTNKPVEVIGGRAVAPRQCLRTLLLVTLYPTQTKAVPALIECSAALFRADCGEALLVDCETKILC